MATLRQTASEEWLDLVASEEAAAAKRLRAPNPVGFEVALTQDLHTSEGCSYTIAAPDSDNI